MRDFKESPKVGPFVRFDFGEEWNATFQGGGIVCVEVLRYEKNCPGGVTVRGVVYGVRAWVRMPDRIIAPGHLYAHRKDRWGNDDKPSATAVLALLAACIEAAERACALRPLGLLEGQVVADWNALRRAEEEVEKTWAAHKAASAAAAQAMVAYGKASQALDLAGNAR